MIERLLLPDRVFDGTETRERIAVGVDRGRIDYVGPASSAPPAAATLRLDGVTLTPGLIDMHVHVTPWNVFGFLAAGVTTVRDVGNGVDVVRGMLGGVPAGFQPDIHWVGPLLDGPEANWPMLARAHRTPEEMARSVHELADRGYRAVKLYANVPADQLAAGAAAGHERGIRVLCHPGVARLRDAVAAGVDEVQHLAGALARDLGAAPGEEAIAALLALDVDHCPTLVVWEGMARIGEPRAHRDAARAWVPAAIEEAWADSRHATMPAEERAGRLDDLVERMRIVGALHAAGRRIVVGSDSAFIGLAPGFALHDELGLLVLSGLTALDAMRAVTSGNAHVLGEDGRVGTIAPGAVADLVAFEGDPTRVITDLGRVRRVWRAGAPIDAADLRASADVVFRERPDAPQDQQALQRFIPAAGH